MIYCEEERHLAQPTETAGDLDRLVTTLKDLIVESAVKNHNTLAYSIDQSTASPAGKRIFARLNDTIESYTAVYTAIADTLGPDFDVEIINNQHRGFKASRQLISIHW